MTVTENKIYGYDVYTISFDTYSRTPTNIQFNNGSDTHKVEFAFENGKTYYGVSYQTFTVGSAGWATAKTTGNVDFTEIDGLEAYTATVSGNTVTLKKQGAVPGGTALVLKGTTTELPLVANAEAITDNDLKWFESYNVTGTYAIYGLALNGDNEAQFTRVNVGQTITNKAILELPITTARELKVVFADEANGIDAVTADSSVEGIFNLNGQRVTAPAKGLYIVNGKKVILK
jgi:hypothetical protein